MVRVFIVGFLSAENTFHPNNCKIDRVVHMKVYSKDWKTNEKPPLNLKWLFCNKCNKCMKTKVMPNGN